MTASNSPVVELKPGIASESIPRIPGTPWHLILPAEHLYWSFVEAPGFAGRGARGAVEAPPGILAEFLLDCPAQPEHLHVICCAVDERRVLVCAAEREELRRVANERDDDAPAISLASESIPDFVGASVDPSEFNLLIGSFEPKPIRRARTVRHAVRACLLVILAGFLALGLTRRAKEWNQEAADARAGSANVLASVVPGLRVNDLAPLLSGYRQAANAAAELKSPTDAAAAFARLLSVWPTNQSAKPQSISVSEQGLNVSLMVEGDPAAFIQVFKAPEGFVLDEPRLNASQGLTRVNLQMRPLARGGARP